MKRLILLILAVLLSVFTLLGVLFLIVTISDPYAIPIFGVWILLGGGLLLPVLAGLSKTTNQDTVRSSSTPSGPTQQTATSALLKEEKVQISSRDLSFHDVIQRYLTTDHASVSAVYDYYSYYRAEFDCLLENLPICPITLHDDRVLRQQEILSPFESTARITKRNNISKLSTFIVIDTETTGIETGGNDIIEISAIRFENFVPVSAFSTFLKPRNPIPEEATQVNGITDAMVQDAPTFAQIKTALETYIGDFPIVAHNAAFDIKFLHVSGLVFSEKARFFDTLQLSRQHIKDWDGSKLENYKLSTVCNECCIHFRDAHQSLTDALATGLLFIEIIKTIFETDNIYEIGAQ